MMIIRNIGEVRMKIKKRMLIGHCVIRIDLGIPQLRYNCQIIVNS